MNFQRGWRRDEPEINLIPLIDLLLVIIIFLVITTTYARFAELQINLPEAQGDTAKESPAQIEVNVDAAGNYRINGGAVAFTGVDGLREELVRAAAGNQDPVVVISADARAAHQSVIHVMDAARRAGFTRVTFVTQTAPETAP
ncbi:MAG: biopolymer transporter ExbD [Thiobacillaceae bacterium]|nr:biopolymer transporter ExbD [Thiobacillaceae bacterium]MCX7672003.1 biopolymer transporter ExbD [Thiobacillaceae bacterium]MDW8323268.1 biopolymer transporter ExbD [Burkholderiales bacterium]